MVETLSTGSSPEAEISFKLVPEADLTLTQTLAKLDGVKRLTQVYPNAPISVLRLHYVITVNPELVDLLLNQISKIPYIEYAEQVAPRFPAQ